MPHDGPGCPAGPRRPRLLQGDDGGAAGRRGDRTRARARRVSPSTSRRSPTAARARWTCCSRALGGELLDGHARAIRSDARSTPRFALLGDGRTALVEVARRAGSRSSRPQERDAEAASSAGTGELIAAAIDAGARHVLVAAGGSATTDGGLGAIEAIERAGGLRGARITVLCDVRTPFERAARDVRPAEGRRRRGGRAARGAGSRRSGCRAACR